MPSYSYKIILCLWMGTLKYCLHAVKPTKEATAVPSLELKGLSELSRESRGKRVWMVGVEKLMSRTLKWQLFLPGLITCVMNG